MPTKDKVLHFIQHDRTLMGARNLYNHFPNKNIGTQQFLANLPNTPENVKRACYALCQLVGIKEKQLIALLRKKVSPATLQNEKNIPVKFVQIQSVDALLLAYNNETALNDVFALAKTLKVLDVPKFEGRSAYWDLRKFVNDQEIPTVGQSKAELETALETFVRSILAAKRQELIDIKAKEIPQKQKESIKLRTQFPFLREANCPKELHLVVAELITAYEEFAAKQPLLHKHMSQEEKTALVKDVNLAYINKSEAFDELQHYKETGTLLGKHPVFEQLKAEEEIMKMNAADLAKKINNLTGNINRNKTKFDSAETPEKKQKYKALYESQEKLKAFAEKELAKR